MRKEYYVDMIEKHAREEEDLKTRFWKDRVGPKFLRALPGGALQSIGAQANDPASAAVGQLLGIASTVGLESRAVKKKFQEAGLTPTSTDYAMANLVPFSSAESRVKRRLREELERSKMEKED